MHCARRPAHSFTLTVALFMQCSITVLPAGHSARVLWMEVARSVFQFDNEEHLEVAFRERDDPDIAPTTYGLTQHPNIAAAKAAIRDSRRRQRATEAQWRQRDKARERDKAEKAAARRAGPLAPRLAEALAVSGSAEEQWVAVLIQLLRDEAGENYWHFDEDRHTDLRTAGMNDLLGAAVDRAAAYLAVAESLDDPFPNGQEVWLVTSVMAALYLIAGCAPDRLRQVERTTWEKWMRVVAGHYVPSKELSLYVAVLVEAIMAAPGAATVEFSRAIDRLCLENRFWLDDAILALVFRVVGIETALLSRVETSRYPTVAAERLLAASLRHGSDKALRVTSSLFNRLTAKRGRARELGLAAGAALFSEAPDRAWTLIWRRLSTDDSLARDFFPFAARGRDFMPHRASESVSDEALADLYLRLEALYPPETDPYHVGVFSPGPRDNLHHWREGVLRTLESRKTHAAVDQLERVARARPSRDYLVRVWLRAQLALHGDRWRGVAPSELMRLAERGESRLVESSRALLHILEESLGRFQNDLQGKWRSVHGLWNEHSDGNMPKAEEHLSNSIARFIERDVRGLVIGRELLLQVGVRGGAPGLRTDIHVSARTTSGTTRGIDRIEAVIEVKGSWNPDLMFAMQSQLVESYLTPHGIRAGLYVVGHYSCASWKKSDARRRSERAGTRARVRANLVKQAKALTCALLELRAIVLDTSLPSMPHRSRLGRGNSGRRRER
jgi:hypothetical protein